MSDCDRDERQISSDDVNGLRSVEIVERGQQGQIARDEHRAELLSSVAVLRALNKDMINRLGSIRTIRTERCFSLLASVMQVLVEMVPIESKTSTENGGRSGLSENVGSWFGVMHKASVANGFLLIECRLEQLADVPGDCTRIKRCERLAVSVCVIEFRANLTLPGE